MESYLFVAILFSWIWIPLLYLIKLFLKKEKLQRFSEMFDGELSNDFDSFTRALVFSASMFVIFYLRIIQFIKYNLPVGPDQGSYMYVLKTVESNPSLLLWGGNLAPGNMYHLIYASPFFPTYFLRLLGLSLENLVIATSLFYGILYPLMIYLFVKETTNHKSLALIAFLTSSLSLSSLITSAMTFRFMIVIVCFYIILTLLFKATGFTKNEYAIPLCITFLISVTVHPEFTLITIPILAGLVFLTYANSRKIGKRFFCLMFWIGASILTFIVITFLLLFLITGRLKIPLIQDILVRSEGYELMFPPCIDPIYFINFYSTGWFSNVVENSVISALAILGLISLIFSKRSIFKDFLLTWTTILTVLIPFFPMIIVHRIYYLLPINVLSAVGILVILSIAEKALKRIKHGTDNSSF